MREEVTKGGRDAAIARLAGRQHGVVSVKQLKDLGLSSSAISYRVGTGRLHPLHRGVYAVGHDGLGNEGRWMAAVLACGGGAALSHISAAQLWRMLPIPNRADGEGLPIHVTVPGEGKHHPGIRVHRSRTLSPADVTLRDVIPVTSPARTLEDLRRASPLEAFANALRQAEFLRLPIGNQWRSDHTRSELEARFLGLLRRSRLPQPEVNTRVDRFVVDFLWRAERLIAEVDGWGSHRTRSAFEADRGRDNRLRVLGFKVIRFTWRQVTKDPDEVATTVRSLLTALW
jgi:very-short-patch-repair endonuclease